MKLVAALLALVAVSYAEEGVTHSAYGYLVKHGVPAAERVRRAEQSRIIGGVPATDGQYPWQAGLLMDLMGSEFLSLCGGSLVSTSRVVTAAHCWSDGVNQAWRFTVVLGSALLFFGGTRVQTSAVAVHPNWWPVLASNDIAVVYLPNPVTLSSTIAPISLPTGAEINEDFAGLGAIASGFGLTGNADGIHPNQGLSHVRLNVITNSACSFAFPLVLQPLHLCTSGVGTVGVCNGDSGGPLIISRGNRNILIGVASFVSQLGCEAGHPSVFSRVTSHIDFINQHM